MKEIIGNIISLIGTFCIIGGFVYLIWQLNHICGIMVLGLMFVGLGEFIRKY